jgi:hypothetical protein
MMIDYIRREQEQITGDDLTLPRIYPVSEAKQSEFFMLNHQLF